MYKKRICLQCEKETLDTLCPYCGGGVFKDFSWQGELENFLKDSSNYDIMQEDIRGGIDKSKLYSFIEYLIKEYNKT